MNPIKTFRRFGLLAALLAAGLLLAGASAAQAAVTWRVTSYHGPTHMAPEGTGRYVIQAYNVASPPIAANNTSEAYEVKDELPPDVIATGASGAIQASGKVWDCSGTAFPTAPGGIVTCTHLGTGNDMLFAPTVGPPSAPPFGSTYASRRGLAPLLFVDVEAAPGASGTENNSVTASGGGPGAVPGSTADPTIFDPTPAGFGLAGGFNPDLYGAQFPAGTPVRQAGSHPFEARFDLDFDQKFTNDPDFGLYTEPEGHVKTIDVKLPKGFVGNPEAAPRCSNVDLYQLSVGAVLPNCPPATQVGTIDLLTQNVDNIAPLGTQDLPVYNMVPPQGALAQFAFSFRGFQTYLNASLDPADHYAVKTTVSYVIEVLPISSSHLTLWGVPAAPGHDALRWHPAANGLSSDSYYGVTSNSPQAPFLTMPSDCSTPASFQASINSWSDPGNPLSFESTPFAVTGCEQQHFDPSLTAKPTTPQADSPSGLSVDLTVPQDLQAKGLGTPALRKAVVTLPEGMTVNPSSADGLGGCSAAQIGLGSDSPVQCPDSSKIGSVQLETPLLHDPVEGSIYLAKPFDNPANSLLSLYIVVSDPDRGLLVKLPGKVEVDQSTGRLTTTFDDNPQLPFSNLHVEFKQGPRAPLRTPSACGTYTTTSELTSWNPALPVTQASDSFQITQGPNGSPCPNGAFKPSFTAGTVTPFAGAYTPFVLRLSREDGTQELKGLSTVLPPGLVGKLAGIPECPQAQVTSASCAPASQIGTVDVGAGAGSNPFHVQGKAYLAGPYKGAPLSAAIITPAIAGPFDLGTVVVQAALQVNPETAQITAVSDEIPHILQGIPLDIRSVEVRMDRDRFTLNPTSCDPMSVGGSATSLQGATASLSDRFQVGACAALGFKPKLGFKLSGATKRGKHPALRATLRMPRGNANIARASVALPHSEFLDQAHIKTICTRVQFAANACPAASVYGHAAATTPLLDQPLSGPVYLRSSSHNLPDLVADLGGQIHVVLAGRIDTFHKGIRTTFEAVPDAPVTKFVLTMQGGRKGLLQNSTDICAKPNRATVKLDAQSGKVGDSRPVLRADCGKQGSRHKRGAARPPRSAR